MIALIFLLVLVLGIWGLVRLVRGPTPVQLPYDDYEDVALPSSGGGQLNPPKPGMVIVGAVRKAPQREQLGERCRAENERTFLFPDELDEFAAYPELPDAECTLKGGCKCKWVYVWGYD